MKFQDEILVCRTAHSEAGHSLRRFRCADDGRLVLMRGPQTSATVCRRTDLPVAPSPSMSFERSATGATVRRRSGRAFTHCGVRLDELKANRPRFITTICRLWPTHDGRDGAVSGPRARGESNEPPEQQAIERADEPELASRQNHGSQESETIGRTNPNIVSGFSIPPRRCRTAIDQAYGNAPDASARDTSNRKVGGRDARMSPRGASIATRPRSSCGLSPEVDSEPRRNRQRFSRRSTATLNPGADEIS